jgi:hypothetical protein
MLLNVCSVSNICREYPVLGRLLRMASLCSLYLVLNVLSLCPIYFFGAF